MNNVFVTSDWHFGHDREFIWKSRGFDSISDHDEKIIDRFNSVVKRNDTVYFLGDIYFLNDEHGIECVKRLNGNIIWIRGNHDSDTKVEKVMNECSNIKDALFADVITKDKNTGFFCCHYPVITDNFQGSKGPKPLYGLFGHTHQMDNNYGDNKGLYHVGVDSHNCYPVSLDEIIKDINSR